MKAKFSVVMFLCAVGCMNQVRAQRETIPDEVKQGSTGRFRTAPSGVAPTIGELLRETDLAVRGVVGEPTSYLSEDQTDVYTDYPIHAPIILFAKDERAQWPTVTLTQLGGALVVDGKPYKQIEQGLAPLEPGMEGVFLLKRVGKRFMVAGTFYGAFRISDAKMTPLTTRNDFAPELRDVEVDTAIANILDVRRAGRPE